MIVGFSRLGAVCLGLMASGCHFLGSGLHPGADAEAPDTRLPEAPVNQDAARDAGREAYLRHMEKPDRSTGETPSVAGLPEDVGCADGTREGFLDPSAWRDIAGCSGGWNVPGVVSDLSRSPQCGRGGGNSSRNPSGIGCSVADLCAPGWHVCANPDEVARRSPTDCESAYPVEGEMFFLVQRGASPQGICSADTTATNDLHGCGNIGQPETQACQPLERRMTFSDCLLTDDVWQCGTAKDHLSEASLVVKANSSLGGVLCCRDK